MEINKKIGALRQLMADEGIDTYIITKFDPHQSEYAPEHWNGVKFISGFTGSAGTVVITKHEAGLWTDGRYFIQAEKELENSEVKLHKATEPGVKSYMEYAVDNTPINGTIGFDGRTLSFEQAKKLLKLIKHKKIIKADEDLLGNIWDNRPKLSQNPVYDHHIKYCGLNRAEKIKNIRAKIAEEGGGAYILSSLDDIAWLFNLRGNDMDNITFFSAYALISEKDTILFIDEAKAVNVTEILNNDGIIIMPYNAVFDYIPKLSGECMNFIVNPTKTSYLLYKAIDEVRIKNGAEITKIEHDFTSIMKSIKNEVEIKCVKESNIRDGAAVVRFIKWLKENVNKISITEYSAAEKLAGFRSTGENYLCTSFNTIAAYMDNAAMMHYQCSDEEGRRRVLQPEGMLLVDSGGNYLDGTTDITRTIALGELSENIKNDFTLVLKSHIALSEAIFLYGATGSNLDVLARMPMWKNCIDYKCGTGHGIGFCLNVHEGPQSISQRPSTVKLEPGMIVTNEPGIYREGQHGIRTENTMLVAEHNETGFGRFLRFEIISFCPIDLEAVNPDMLTEGEKKWLNSYHKTVYDRLSPLLNEDEQAWLKEQTHEI